MYDHEKKGFRAWQRREALEPVENVEGFQSPRLGVRFWTTAQGLKVERPDGTFFESYVELWRRLRALLAPHQDTPEFIETFGEVMERVRRLERIRRERERAEQAHQQADQAQEQADRAHAWAERLPAKLRSLGIDPNAP